MSPVRRGARRQTGASSYKIKRRQTGKGSSVFSIVTQGRMFCGFQAANLVGVIQFQSMPCPKFREKAHGECLGTQEMWTQSSRAEKSGGRARPLVSLLSSLVYGLSAVTVRNTARAHLARTRQGFRERSGGLQG